MNVSSVHEKFSLCGVPYRRVASNLSFPFFIKNLIELNFLLDELAAEFLKVAHMKREVIIPCKKGRCYIIENENSPQAQCGDSGGPWFYYDKNENPILLGVHQGLGLVKQFEGIVNSLLFMSSEYYLNWIKRNIK